MLIEYHQKITHAALENLLSSTALQTIINYNIRQDGLIYQLGFSHFHFDNNAIAESNSYIEEQRSLVIFYIQNEGYAWSVAFFKDSAMFTKPVSNG